MPKEVGGKQFRPPEDAQKPSRQSIAEARAAFAEFDRHAGRHRGRYHEEELVPPGAGALAVMPHRVYGDRSVDQWPGSADEQAALRVRAESAASSTGFESRCSGLIGTPGACRHRLPILG